jgi:hypothetical protein
MAEWYSQRETGQPERGGWVAHRVRHGDHLATEPPEAARSARQAAWSRLDTHLHVQGVEKSLKALHAEPRQFATL